MIFFIFIVAFIIRLVYIIQLKSSVFYSHFILDEAFYDSWARSIAGGEWLGEKIFEALPLYPYFLGAIYRLSGNSLFIPRLIGAILSSLSCALIYGLSKRFFNKHSGMIAGLIACFYAPFIFYSGLLAPTTLAVFLYLLSFCTLSRALDKPTFFRFFSFGLIIGLAALAKAGILLFLPAVLIWAIITFNEKKKVIAGALFALAGVLAVILPVSLRNYLVSGDLVFLTSHSGVNFYIGNNQDADGIFKPPQWARTNVTGLQTDARTIAEGQAGRSLKDSEVSRFYLDKSLRFIRGHPLRFLRLLGRKFFFYTNRQELYDIAYYQIYREHIPILKFPFISFLLVGSLGLAGVFIGFSSWRKIAPLYLFVFTYTVSILAYFVNSRYRLPFAMMMVIFSGFLISWAIAKWREKRYLAVSSVVILGLALAGFISLPTGLEITSTGYTNLGNIYINAGQLDKAVEALKKAIEFDDSDPKPYNDIGYVYIMQNKLEDAERALLASLSRNPRYPFVHINLGLLYGKKGDFESAEKECRQAIRLNPNIPEAHATLADAYEMTNRRSQAIEEYQRAIELDPANGMMHYNLGVIYSRQERLNEAREEFERAIQVEPSYARAHYNLGAIYFRQGRLKEARQEFEKAVELDPGYGLAREALRHFR